MPTVPIGHQGWHRAGELVSKTNELANKLHLRLVLYIKLETMDNSLTPVAIVTGFLLIYVVAVAVNLNTAVILLLFSLSPILMIWMVIRVLKAVFEPAHTFEEKWYEDQ